MAKKAAPAKSETPAAKLVNPDKTRAKRQRSGWKLVNRQQLGLLMGVHPDTVTDYVREGMPVVTRGGRGRESSYDAVACLDWQRLKAGKNAKEAAQTALYTKNAELAQMKLDRERGELVSRDDVARAGRAYTAAWRAKVLGLPRRFVQVGLIAKADEPHAMAECRDLLTAIADWKTQDDCEQVAADA